MDDCLTRLRCSGCGYEPARDEPLPFRCANAGEGDVDHVLRRELIADRAESARGWHDVFLAEEANPFIRYRDLLYSFNVARERGLSDEEYMEVVRSLDGAIETVTGTGFVETPCQRLADLNQELGRTSGALWIKDETNNVSGSHKARHLAGIMLWLEIAKRTGLAPETAMKRRLAIASCGNAALAAAVVAKAADFPLDVFIPPGARPSVTKELEELGANLTICRRDASEPGDPCVHGFRQDLESGALPFSVQGNENGLTLEGGLTLGWEIVSTMLRENASLDRFFIQVGGGALASSCAQALREAVSLGLLSKMPKVHAVQTKGGYPLRRAWELVVRHLLGGVAPLQPETDEEVANRIARPEMKDDREAVIRYAATHRSEFMWPWETPPESAAYGILDDETYDWLSIVESMLETGGYPVVATEDQILEANEIAKRATQIRVEHTGTAGLAGLMRVLDSEVVDGDESIAVLFTGCER